MSFHCSNAVILLAVFASLPSNLASATAEPVKLAGWAAAAEFTTVLGEADTPEACLKLCEARPPCFMVTVGKRDAGGVSCSGSLNVSTIRLAPSPDASLLAVDKSGPFTRVNDFDYPFDDLFAFPESPDHPLVAKQNTTTPDPETCLLLCKLHPDCNVALFNTLFNVCFIKHKSTLNPVAWNEGVAIAYTCDACQEIGGTDASGKPAAALEPRRRRPGG